MEGARNISPMVTVGRDGSMARLERTNGLSKGLRNALGLEMFSTKGSRKNDLAVSSIRPRI